MSTDKPQGKENAGAGSRAPTDRKVVGRVERTAGGQNIKEIVPMAGTVNADDDAQTMAHTTGAGAGPTSTNLQPMINTSANARDKTSAGSEAGNHTMMVLPSMQTSANSRSGRDRTSVGRRYISVEAVVRMPDGKRYSFRTRKVSSRALFLSAATSMLPISRGTDVDVELRGDKRTVSFKARVAHVVKEDVHGLGEAGFGFQIISISREQQAELEQLIAETPSRADIELVEKKKRNKQLGLGGAVLAAVALLGFAAYQMRPIPKMHVETSRAKVAPFEETLQSMPGEIVPHRSFIVKSTLSRPLIVEVLVKRGATVKAGDPLAQSFQVHVAMKDISSKIDAATQELEELKTKEGSAAQQAALTGKIASLKDDLTRKTQEATKIQVVAPFNGIISDLSVQTGEELVPNATLAELVDTEELRASVPFSEADAAKIKRGMKVHVVTPARDLDGTIEELGAVVRTYGKGKAVLVEAVLEKAEDVRPGSTARVDVILNERKALGVPEDAAVGTGNTRKVWVVNSKNRLEAHSVEIGNVSRGVFEVFSGLNDGAIVVRHPSSDLVSGGEVFPPAE